MKMTRKEYRELNNKQVEKEESQDEVEGYKTSVSKYLVEVEQAGIVVADLVTIGAFLWLMKFYQLTDNLFLMPLLFAFGVVIGTPVAAIIYVRHAVLVDDLKFAGVEPIDSKFVRLLIDRFKNNK